MILLYDEIKKERNPSLAALRILRAFLDENEPKLARFLVNAWRSQGKAITYKEIREAIMYVARTGNIDDVKLFTQLIYDWQQDYSRFVVETIAPTWTHAFETASTRLERKFPTWSFDATKAGIKTWTDNMAATFVTNSTATQISAVREVVKRAAQVQDLTVDTLAQVIRPMVGLTKQQSVANLNYFNSMIESGIPQTRAIERSIRYSAQQSRYRAYNIARTELAFSYNHGEDMAVRQAQAAGLMGTMRKQWCTAADERVCPICGGLEGVIVDMDQEFDFYTRLSYPGIRLTAPAHPSCRCVVLYIEVEPPKF